MQLTSIPNCLKSLINWTIESALKSEFFLNVYRISSINFDCLLKIEEIAVKKVEIDAIIKNNTDSNERIFWKSS